MLATCRKWFMHRRLAILSFDRPSTVGMQGPVDRGRLLKHPSMRNTRNILGKVQAFWKFRDGILHGVLQSMNWNLESVPLEADGGRVDQSVEKVPPVTAT
jgi:hypothetical protein